MVLTVYDTYIKLEISLEVIGSAINAATCITCEARVNQSIVCSFSFFAYCVLGNILVNQLLQSNLASTYVRLESFLFFDFDIVSLHRSL